MKKLFPFVIFCAVLMFGATSCKKYEDGPTFSLASKKGRVAGEWTIEKATIRSGGNSQDATASMQQSWQKVKFTKDGDFSIESEGDIYAGTWDFDSDKENLLVSADGESLVWEIKRLKSKELWVKWSLSSSTYYEFQFKQ